MRMTPRLLQSTARWTADAVAARRQLKTYFGAAHTNVELLCTENNSIGESTGKQTTSLVNALYLADSFGQIVQTEFNSFLWWNLRNIQDHNANNSPTLYGWRQYGDHGIMCGNDTRYPTFYTFKLLKYFARGGDRIVRATSDNKLLSAYAARRADGTLALLVINKSPGATLKADISIAGFQPESGATIYSYGIPQDEAARTGTGSPDIAQTAFSRRGGGIPPQFAPYSATVMVTRAGARQIDRFPSDYRAQDRIRQGLRFHGKSTRSLCRSVYTPSGPVSDGRAWDAAQCFQAKGLTHTSPGQRPGSSSNRYSVAGQRPAS